MTIRILPVDNDEELRVVVDIANGVFKAIDVGDFDQELVERISDMWEIDPFRAFCSVVFALYSMCASMSDIEEGEINAEDTYQLLRAVNAMTDRSKMAN